MILEGDCLEVMRTFPDNHFSAIVTDPPYGLSFMGKGWDHEVPGIEYWKECIRIIKPGGFLLALGGSRTFHRQVSAIEDAGWEIRDCLMWIYGSGFPKSHNHFGIRGFGTALKPAFEPVTMAMKPCDGTFKQNAEKWGQAGINIDACRIPHVGNISGPKIERSPKTKGILGKFADHSGEVSWAPDPSKGRWPANVIFDEEAAAILDGQSGIGASRFFYCAKASSSERNEGLDGMPYLEAGIKNDSGRGFSESDPHKSIQYKNNHPTVKPLKLMQYLIKLVMPPENGLLLDPFCGSGTTILAAKQLGFDAIGIEKSPEYCEIARKRLEHCEKELSKEDSQMDLFEQVNF